MTTVKRNNVTVLDLLALCLRPSLRCVVKMWLNYVEQHYLACAEREAEYAKEANLNCSYYQKKAALARSAKLILDK